MPGSQSENLIPHHEKVRQKLVEMEEQVKLLRRQLRVSEDNAIEANRRARPEVSRYRREGEGR
jgi:hypothetical protein